MTKLASARNPEPVTVTTWPVVRPVAGSTVSVGGGASGPSGAKSSATDAVRRGSLSVNPRVPTSAQLVVRQSKEGARSGRTIATRSNVVETVPSAATDANTDGCSQSASVVVGTRHSLSATAVWGTKPVPE